MIELKNVSKTYRDTGICALQDVSLHIGKGEFVFLIGATGAGKSTLTKLLLREEKADRGNVLVNGVDVGKLRRRKIPKLRREIGVVFQDFRLLPDRTVYENVAFAMQVIGKSKRTIRHIVPQVLTLVGLTEKANFRPDQLSGGERQRASMARALVNNPPLLIADEPTGNLDPQTSEEIMTLLERIHQRGTTVLVVTHDKAIVDRMQKRVLTMEGGTIIRDEEKGGYQLG